MINQWQLALDNGSLPAFIAGLAPRHPQYEAMHQSLLALVADSRPWPQMTGSGSLRPGEWSNDIGALREILQRTGMLEKFRQYRSARRRGESFGEEKSKARGARCVRSPAGGGR